MKLRSAHINHVTILVKDKLAAEKFYTEILGLEAMRVGKSLWLRVGEQYIHVTENHGGTPKSFAHFCIGMENLDVYLHDLAAKGVEVFDLDAETRKISVNSEWDKLHRQFFIHDLDGNLVEFCDTLNEYFYQNRS